MEGTNLTQVTPSDCINVNDTAFKQSSPDDAPVGDGVHPFCPAGARHTALLICTAGITFSANSLRLLVARS
jgi:hypothetical protein